MDGSFVNLAPFLGRHDSPFYYSFFFGVVFVFVLFLFCFVSFLGFFSVVGVFLEGFFLGGGVLGKLYLTSGAM